MSRLLWKAIGGRPMKCLGFAFTDVVSGRPVFYFADRLGREWMADGPWSIFRVEVQP